jgi:hypothetical protein
MTKACVNCAHYHYHAASGDTPHRCIHPDAPRSMVLGHPPPCNLMRTDSARCGVGAKWFSHKDETT